MCSSCTPKKHTHTDACWNKTPAGGEVVRGVWHGLPPPRGRPARRPNEPERPAQLRCQISPRKTASLLIVRHFPCAHGDPPKEHSEDGAHDDFHPSGSSRKGSKPGRKLPAPRRRGRRTILYSTFDRNQQTRLRCAASLGRRSREPEHPCRLLKKLCTQADSL